MSQKTLVMNRIAEEMKNPNPSKKKILGFLSDLQLYDFEFLNGIGETYKLNPLFFMKALYSNIWKKMGKKLGEAGRSRGERYIIENYSLNDGEQIIYECEGSIQKKKPLREPYIKLSVSSGIIFITNHRIIAHGKFTVKELVQARTAVLPGFTGGYRNKQYRIEKKFLFEASELCFGYTFPVKNLSNLKRRGRTLSYNLVDGKTTLTTKKGKIDKLFDIINQFQ